MQPHFKVEKGERAGHKSQKAMLLCLAKEGLSGRSMSSHGNADDELMLSKSKQN